VAGDSSLRHCPALFGFRLPGLHDEGLLDSALVAPADGHYYGNAGLATCAAAYLTWSQRTLPRVHRLLAGTVGEYLPRGVGFIAAFPRLLVLTAQVSKLSDYPETTFLQFSVVPLSNSLISVYYTWLVM
jgi:hypothetical protein